MIMMVIMKLMKEIVIIGKLMYSLKLIRENMYIHVYDAYIYTSIYTYMFIYIHIYIYVYIYR
jgi:hypothetical protein